MTRRGNAQLRIISSSWMSPRRHDPHKGNLLAPALGTLRFHRFMLGDGFGALEPVPAFLATVLIGRHGPSSNKAEPVSAAHSALQGSSRLVRPSGPGNRAYTREQRGACSGPSRERPSLQIGYLGKPPSARKGLGFLFGCSNGAAKAS
jgi:hypothetical protein